MESFFVQVNSHLNSAPFFATARLWIQINPGYWSNCDLSLSFVIMVPISNMQWLHNIQVLP